LAESASEGLAATPGAASMAARTPPVIVADNAVAATVSVAETNAVVTSNPAHGLRFVIMTILPLLGLHLKADYAQAVFLRHVSVKQDMFQLFRGQKALSS
jgi:hypothetical protein